VNGDTKLIMISSNDFDYFLKHGFMENLSPGASMSILLAKFGDDHWYTKEKEPNGLAYGIIKIGFIEFHIYDEKVSGISYRPDHPFSKDDFGEQVMPWIYKAKEISKVEEHLRAKKIDYNKYIVTGPLEAFATTGALVGLGEGEHTFIDTEGGVTFLFEDGGGTGAQTAYQICKYYNINKQKLR
jgi:hypothetical protein